MIGGVWQTKTLKGKWEQIDPEPFFNNLGEQGWELVTAVAESGTAGGRSSIGGATAFGAGRTTGEFRDIVGFTDNEIWVFKRPTE
ncbi:MAG TPA: hypothetical protein VF352_02605 [Anaerolineales bacterium]